MCESDVYFETYRHVYGVLKSFTEDTFPMKNYLIDVDVCGNISPDCMHFPQFIKKKTRCRPLDRPVQPSPHYPSYIPAKGKVLYTYKHNTLDLKDTATWPSAAVMKFNDSQLDAMKHALTRQFSVIQGPPGCGKTHMGLAIIATLLMNTDSQILIVSYTNHALDQFLMGLLRYTDSIVRIGNQSKNESLDCFNIKQLCENGIADKRIKTSLFRLKTAYSEAVQEFNDLQGFVANNSESLEGVFAKYAEIQVTRIEHPSQLQAIWPLCNLPFHFRRRWRLDQAAVHLSDARGNEADRRIPIGQIEANHWHDQHRGGAL